MDRFVASKIDFKDILMWIKFEDPTYFEAFRGPDDNGTGMTHVGGGGTAVDSEELIFRWQAKRACGGRHLEHAPRRSPG
jgi:hypothetical protein